MNFYEGGIGFILVSMLLVALVSSGLAHEKAPHKENSGMSEHMQAMMALKGEIPEEYRIMERTPLLPDEESLQHGQKLFLPSCSVCHGENGDGKGLAAASLKTPPANFLDKKHSAIYGPGEKFWIVGHGTGKTGMPAFPNISVSDRRHLVNYILSLPQEGSEKQKDHGYH